MTWMNIRSHWRHYNFSVSLNIHVKRSCVKTDVSSTVLGTCNYSQKIFITDVRLGMR